MTKHLLIGLMAAALAGSVFADSIDDAEAKRRGVPVVVIQLESQLAAQKKKTADVEKQIADVEKKIAEINAPKAAQTPQKSGAMAMDPALPKPVGGERKSSPLYDEYMKRYMSGDWTKLMTDMAAKGPQMAGLPAGNAADIAYVRAAILQCKPAWWEKAKAGGPVTFTAPVFGRTVTVNYTPGRVTSQAITRSGKLVILASWPPNLMDTTDPVNEAEKVTPPLGSYTEGDLLHYTAWSLIAMHVPVVDMGEVKVATLDKTDERNVANNRNLLGTCAGMYYSTPTSRYLSTSVEAMAPEHKFGQEWQGRREFTAFLLQELLAHPERYPSLKMPTINLPDDIPSDSDPERYILDTGLAGVLKGSNLTFAEDCAMRQAIWEFVMANTDWAADQIKLPSGTTIENDPAKEKEAKKDRWNWYRHATEVKPKDVAPAPEQPK